MVEIPIAWILAGFGTLGTVVAGLFHMLMSSSKARVDAQDARIDAQDKLIDALRKDIERMAKGCGLDTCHWRGR